jgi:hypothetical protein
LRESVKRKKESYHKNENKSHIQSIKMGLQKTLQAHIKKAGSIKIMLCEPI